MNNNSITLENKIFYDHNNRKHKQTNNIREANNIKVAHYSPNIQRKQK